MRYLYWFWLGAAGLALVCLAALYARPAHARPAGPLDTPTASVTDTPSTTATATTPTATATASPSSTAPMATPYPTATHTYCILYSLGATSSCATAGTYNYTFDFYSSCGLYGYIYLDFEVAEDGAGPWSVADQRTDHVLIGPRIAGSFSEPNLSPQYRYFRIYMSAYTSFASDDNVTAPAYTCNQPPSPTPCPACATPTPPACATGWRDFPTLSDGAVWAASGTAAGDVWTAGQYEATNSHPATLIEHWDGTSLQVVPSLSGNGPNNYLFDVTALSANDAWAVGEYFNEVDGEQTLIEHWNGTAWSSVPSPNVLPDNGLRAISALAANDIWAVGSVESGSYEGEVLIVHWDGNTWRRVPTPLLPSYPYLQSVKAIAPNDVWAAGYYGTTQALTLHWDGQSWTQVSNGVPSGSQLNAIDGLRADDVWAVGSYQGQTLAIHWNGTQWRQIASPAFPLESELRGVAPVGSGDVWAAGASGRYGDSQNTLLLHWDGSQWSTIPSPNPGADINNFADVFAAAPGEIWAVGSTGSVYTGRRMYIAHYTAACPAPTPTPTPTSVPCMLSFSDVQPADYFYAPVQYLACRGVISGYGDGTFRPYNPTTRAQMVKLVVLGFTLPVQTPGGGAYTFADVPPAQPFFAVIETAAAHAIVGGYTCGGPGEPCDEQQRPYFRPNASVTRGQLSKITVQAAAWALINPASATFADVPPASPFYAFVETAVCHGLISGYGCGGPGEPCNTQHRPYFRQYNNATRGQIAKILYGALTGSGACDLAR